MAEASLHNTGVADEYDEIRQSIRGWFQRNQGKPFDALCNGVEKMADAVLRETGDCLAGEFNNWLRTQGTNEIAEKQRLAKMVNDRLRSFGLGITCPKTGNAGHLLGEFGPNAKRGRFRLVVPKDDGGQWRTTSWNELPTLSLSPLKYRSLGRAPWTKRLERGEPGAQEL
jgi:hypothetical protein